MNTEALDNLKSAITSGRTDIVRSILSTCEKCEENDEGDISVSQILNALSTDHGSVLHLATQLGQEDVVRILLSSDADPGVHNKDGKTPFDLAPNEKVKKVFNEELLKSTAASNVGRVCQLIAAGVSVNLQDNPVSKNTPIHWAATYGNREIVQCLCDRNADVNAVNNEGATPLHDAVHRGDVHIVEELVLSGANPTIKALAGKHGGKTAMDLALSKPEIKAFFDQQPVMNGHASGLQDDLKFDRQNSIASENSALTEKSGFSVLSPKTPNGPLAASTTPNLTFKGGNEGSPGPAAMASSSKPEPVHVITDPRLHYLWPQPQKLIQKEGKPFQIKDFLHLYIVEGPEKDMLHKIADAWSLRGTDLQLLGILFKVDIAISGNIDETNEDESCILCHVNNRLFTRSESYKIIVTEKQVKLLASDMNGLFYGVITFMQLVRLCYKDGIPPLKIIDWPGLRDRGVLLDLSKGKIPKHENLMDLIDKLVDLKINEIHLYIRADIPKEPGTWQFPYTRSELLEVDRLCRESFVSLVPVLDISPKVTYGDLPTLYTIFQEFLACFTNKKTINIGPRLSSFLLEEDEEGEKVTRLEVPSKVLPVTSDQLIQLCAYIYHESMEPLQTMPLNIMLMEYGFQATYDFSKFCRQYEDVGISFCVCPGTSAWNSIAGCPEAAVSNIYNAVQTARKHHALGMVVCTWAGVGSITHEPINWPGFMAGAGLAWNTHTHWDFLHANLAELINKHILRDEAGVTGQVIIELGRAETYMLRCARRQPADSCSNLPAESGSTMYQLLVQPDKVAIENLNLEVLQKTMRHIRKCQAELAKSRLLHPAASIIVSQLQLTADLMLSACRICRALVSAGRNPQTQDKTTGYSVINLGVANLPPTSKTDLANRLIAQLEQYRSVWMASSLPVGLQESLLTLSAPLKQYVPDQDSNKQS